MLFVLLVLSNMACFSQAILLSDYIGTYNILYIKKNNVLSQTVFWVDNPSDKKNRIDKIYTKYFNEDFYEQKIINFTKKGEIADVDSFSYTNNYAYADVYTIKRSKAKLTSKIFPYSERDQIIQNKALRKSYKFNKINTVYFIAEDKFYKYTSKSMTFMAGYNYDSLKNLTLRILYDDEYNLKRDTMNYIYDYANLYGKSFYMEDNQKILHSILILNDKLLPIREDFYNIPYSSFSLNPGNESKPQASIICNYLENGLVSSIEQIENKNVSYKYIFQYEYRK